MPEIQDSDEIIKMIALQAIAKIPYIGEIVSFVNQIFGTQSVWDQIREQVEKMIDEKILAAQVKEMEGIYLGLENRFRDACHTKGRTQYDLFRELNGQFYPFREMFKSLPRTGREWEKLLPFITLLAVLDVMVLNFYIKLGETYEEDKENLAYFRKVHEQLVQDYKDYILNAANATIRWRVELIDIRYERDIYGTGETIIFVTDGYYNKRFTFEGKTLPQGKTYLKDAEKEMRAYLLKNCVGPISPWGVPIQGDSWKPKSPLADVIAAIVSLVGKR